MFIQKEEGQLFRYFIDEDGVQRNTFTSAQMTRRTLRLFIESEYSDWIVTDADEELGLMAKNSLAKRHSKPTNASLVLLKVRPCELWHGLGDPYNLVEAWAKNPKTNRLFKAWVIGHCGLSLFKDAEPVGCRYTHIADESVRKRPVARSNSRCLQRLRGADAPVVDDPLSGPSASSVSGLGVGLPANRFGSDVELRRFHGNGR